MLAIPKSYADGEGVEVIDNSDMISHQPRKQNNVHIEEQVKKGEEYDIS